MAEKTQTQQYDSSHGAPDNGPPKGQDAEPRVTDLPLKETPEPWSGLREVKS
jgi:hypothetical protein